MKDEPAFPVSIEKYCENVPAFKPKTRTNNYAGLTKREYFAAMAMQGLCAEGARLLSILHMPS